MGIESIVLNEIDSQNEYGNRMFSIVFEPKAIGSEKILGFINRKAVEVKIRLFTLKEIVSRVLSSNTSLANLFDDLKTDSKNKRMFFYQPKIVYKQEHFVLVVADKGYDYKLFTEHSFSISMNKYFWKVAQNNDILISLNSNGIHSIFVNGRPYKYSFFQKHIKEYGDLNKALSICISSSSSSFIDINESLDLKIPSMVLFSDLHLADKTSIDNFGSIKEEHLVKMLKSEIKNKNTYVIIPGDFMDLWQTTIGNVEDAYLKNGSLLKEISRIVNLVLIAGNHDESILEDKTVNKWTIKQFPNAKILSGAMVSSKNIDLIVYHGDKQDPSNNHTVFGKTVSKFAALLEKTVKPLINPNTGRSSLEQRLMGFLERNLSPTKILIDSYIIRNLTSFITDINIYIYLNKDKLSAIDGKRKFAIVLGHTHEMIKNNDNSSIQTVLKLLIDEFILKTPVSKQIHQSFLINKVDVKHINTGTGSGEALLNEKTESKNRWKTVLNEMRGLRKEGLGYYEYLRRNWPGDDPVVNGKQDSIFVYEDKNSDNVLFSYTETDYCSKTPPVEF